MPDSGKRPITPSLGVENDTPLAEMRRVAGRLRRVSKDEKSSIVAECGQSGACLRPVACGNRVPLESLRRWVRAAGGTRVAKLEREHVAAQP